MAVGEGELGEAAGGPVLEAAQRLDRFGDRVEPFLSRRVGFVPGVPLVAATIESALKGSSGYLAAPSGDSLIASVVPLDFTGNVTLSPAIGLP